MQRGRGGNSGWLGAAALLVLPAPLAGQDAAPVDCAAVAAERGEVAAEREAVKDEITRIAFGRTPRKKGRSGGAAAGAAAKTAAGVLLPFPFGILVGAGASAAGKKKKGEPAPAGPDVPALIERQRLLEARLAELAAAGCP